MSSDKGKRRRRRNLTKEQEERRQERKERRRRRVRRTFEAIAGVALFAWERIEQRRGKR